MLRIGVGIGVLWLVLAGLFTAFLASINIPTLRHIASNEATVVGTVIRKDCPNHARVFYSFTVSGQPYHGSDSMGADCARLIEGQDIKIYYNSGHPDESTAFHPREALWNEIIPIGLVALVFPPIIVWRVMRAFSKAGKSLL
jgi:hypothetical protein